MKRKPGTQSPGSDAEQVSRGTEPPVSRFTPRAFAWLVVRLRWLILLAWVVAAVAATLYLPPLEQVEASAIGDLVPKDTPALKAEADSYRLFGFPVLSRTAIVQRNPHGLPLAAQTGVVLRAVQLTTGKDPEFQQIAGAFPITNTLGLFPGSRERSTTAITYLFFDPNVGLYDQTAIAQRYAHRRINAPSDSLVGVTGPAPARSAQNDIILNQLPLVEAATVILIALIVGLTFRAVGAPLATLFTAGIAYVIAIRAVAWAGQRLNVSVPADLEPVIVVLLLGVVTDYAVFFLTGMRVRLLAGDRRVDAAKRTTGEFSPIIFTAGLLVTAGTAALLAARLGFLRAFGPGLALTVLVALVVTITLMPALIAIFGGALFWPRRLVPGRVTQPSDHEGRRTWHWRERLVRFATAKPIALLIVAGAVGVLIVPALNVRRIRLGFQLIQALPADEEAARAAKAAREGFAPGILSPTLVVLQEPGIGGKPAQLLKLEEELRRQKGVAGVIGPAEQSLLQQAGLQNVEGAAVARDGNAAQYGLILDHEPLGGIAIRDIKNLKSNMPSLLRSAGLGEATAGFAGDTALAQETIDLNVSDLGRISLAMVLVDLVLLMIFLRAVIAPLYLLAASVLALAASLGLTVFVFQTVLGQQDITYYVPFAAAVLLVSLGSDYNVFVVGRIWEEARRRPLRDAIAVAAPRAARAITVAAVALAGSFALLAVVPLGQFREFAFAMTVGVLIDSFIVRSLLVPALISVFGTSGGWPGGRLRQEGELEAPPVDGRYRAAK
jgi:putative drug exporter of the RND superfamily